MATRTVESGYFGSVGMSDPMSSFAERTLRVAWDFGKKSVTQNVSGGGVKAIPLLPIPKGFCVDRISVVQTAQMNAALTLTFGIESDDSVTLGGNFALANTATLLRSSQDPDATNKTALFVTANDMLCMIVPASASATATTFDEGAFDLCIHGFEAFSEGTAAGVDSTRPTLQTTNNVSGGQWPLG